eukprot:6188063-Pleurochrysis_carterae.AAC.3
MQLEAQSRELAQKLAVPLLLSKQCSAPKPEHFATKRRTDLVYLVEYDGLSTYAYCNLSGLRQRGIAVGGNPIGQHDSGLSSDRSIIFAVTRSEKITPPAESAVFAR